jgi:hypothetical protein
MIVGGVAGLLALQSSFLTPVHSFQNYVGCDLIVRRTTSAAVGQPVMTTQSAVMGVSPVDNAALAAPASTEYTPGEALTINFGAGFVRGFAHASAGTWGTGAGFGTTPAAAGQVGNADLSCQGTNSIIYYSGPLATSIVFNPPAVSVGTITLSFAAAQGFSVVSRTTITLTQAPTATPAPPTIAPTMLPPGQTFAPTPPTVAPTEMRDICDGIGTLGTGDGSSIGSVVTYSGFIFDVGCFSRADNRVCDATTTDAPSDACGTFYVAFQENASAAGGGTFTPIWNLDMNGNLFTDQLMGNNTAVLQGTTVLVQGVNSGNGRINVTSVDRCCGSVDPGGQCNGCNGPQCTPGNCAAQTVVSGASSMVSASALLVSVFFVLLALVQKL